MFGWKSHVRSSSLFKVAKTTCSPACDKRVTLHCVLGGSVEFRLQQEQRVAWSESPLACALRMNKQERAADTDTDRKVVAIAA